MHSNPEPSTSQKTILVCFRIFFYYALPFAYIFFTVANWNEMTPCLRRQALFISFYCIYIRFAEPGKPFFLFDIIQILAVLWIVEHYNSYDTGIDPSCSDSQDSVFTFLTHRLFRVLLVTYTVSIVCLALSLLAVVTFALLEVFSFGPRRMQRAGLSENELNSLKKTVFASVPDQDESDLTTCSICVCAFINGETVVNLPRCVHIFHEECLKGWLKYHSTCPNCRSNIRRNPTGEQTGELRSHSVIDFEQQPSSIEIQQ